MSNTLNDNHMRYKTNHNACTYCISVSSFHSYHSKLFHSARRVHYDRLLRAICERIHLCRRSTLFLAPAIKMWHYVRAIRSMGAARVCMWERGRSFKATKSDGWPDCEHPSHDYKHNNFDAVIWFNAFVVQHLRFPDANLFICEFLFFLLAKCLFIQKTLLVDR